MLTTDDIQTLLRAVAAYDHLRVTIASCEGREGPPRSADLIDKLRLLGSSEHSVVLQQASDEIESALKMMTRWGGYGSYALKHVSKAYGLLQKLP